MVFGNLFEKYPDSLESLRSKAINWFEKYSLPRWFVFTLDNISVLAVFFISYFLRFNLNINEINFPQAVHHSLITLVIYSFFCLIFRSYTGLIRHTTLTDITLVFMVTTVSTLLLISLSLIGRMLNWPESLIVPLSIILIHYVAITVCLSFGRVLVKLIFKFTTSTMKERKHVLIYGAGEMGFVVKRVLLSDSQNSYTVEGFIDTNRQLQGKKINNIPVFSLKVLSNGFVPKHKVSTLVFAVNDLEPKIKSEIIHAAMAFNLEILEAPSVDKWLNGRLQLNQLYKVKLEDLLGREPIKLNMEAISNGLHGKTMLVTGAAGSIGSELVRQLSYFNTGKMVLIDQAETPLYNLENELREKFKHIQFQLILADITNPEKMELIFKKYSPDIVFHAAAYKHVPMIEENPHEAFRVNIIGTLIVTNLSQKYNVQKFVMISSDKSVNPSSVMGVSKRICEYIVQSRAKAQGINTRFVITRFGNVLGSNGSVVPLFTKQIEEGGPVTVTHPDITRYFMTIPEACQLVLEAGFMSNGGEIYVFDMGKPIKILDLARNMIRLSGFEPDKDIKIVFTGLRPGEKLYEEVLSNQENTLPTYHPKIKIATPENHDFQDLIPSIIDIYSNMYELSESEIVEFFSKIVPEFRSTNNRYTSISVKDKTELIEPRNNEVLIPCNIEMNNAPLSKAL